MIIFGSGDTSAMFQFHSFNAQDLPVPSMGDLCPGMYCVAQYSEDRLWYRARIEELLTGSQVNKWELLFHIGVWWCCLFIYLGSVKCCRDMLAALDPGCGFVCGIVVVLYYKFGVSDLLDTDSYVWLMLKLCSVY